MGYAWNGTCYQSGQAALDAFAVTMVGGGDGAITTFTDAPTINGSGLITWSISHRPLTDTTATTRTGTTQLLSCSTESMQQWPVQSILVFVALFFAAFSGLKTGLGFRR